MKITATGAQRANIGPASVDFIESRSILTRPSGFADFYDYTLNPYSGCTFGCAYCYAAFFARSDVLKETWGQWVHVKENALELLKKQRSKPIFDKTIYMSTVTDPYQPVEKDLALTRALLEELLAYHEARLVVQTRSPLVTRDIDLLTQFQYVQVNMTVTTDDDGIRKVFEPTCSSIERRLDAISEVRAAGLKTSVTMTPLLPVTDPEAFGRRLLATGAERFAIQYFHPNSGRFMSSTPDEAHRLYRDMGWNFGKYDDVRRVLRRMLPVLIEGKDGFIPWWAAGGAA